MDTLTLLLAAPLVLAAEGAIVGFAAAHPDSRHELQPVLRGLYRNPLGIGVLVAAWLLLTAVVLVYEFFFALIGMYGLLFTGGRVLAWAGLVVFGAMFLATPGVCGWIVVRFGRQYRPAAGAGARTSGYAGPDPRGQAIPSH